MPKIIVTADPSGSGEAPVLLEESMHPVHISSDHAARQLIERLVCALGDAEALAAPGAGARAAETSRRRSLRPAKARRLAAPARASGR